jgi:hypothetical protein
MGGGGGVPWPHMDVACRVATMALTSRVLHHDSLHLTHF